MTANIVAPLEKQVLSSTRRHLPPRFRHLAVFVFQFRQSRNAVRLARFAVKVYAEDAGRCTHRHPNHRVGPRSPPSFYLFEIFRCILEAVQSERALILRLAGKNRPAFFGNDFQCGLQHNWRHDRCRFHDLPPRFTLRSGTGWSSCTRSTNSTLASKYIC